MAVQSDPRKSLSIILSAMAAGQLAFLAIALVVQRSVVPPEGMDAMTLPLVAAVLVIGTIAASLQVGRALVAAAGSKPDTAERLQAFQRAVITRLAIVEGASFVTIAFYLISGEWLFLALFAVSFGAFLFQRPRSDEWEQMSKGSVL